MSRIDPRVRDLDPAALAALLAVIESGSFTEAAKSLHVSQPAVSLAIKRLEERLGTVLLVRNRKRVAASHQGELLGAGARMALDALGGALAQIANEHVEPSGRVLLGVHESLAAYSLPAFMARFLREYPRVELTLWNGRSQEVEHELLAGRVDLALIVNPTQHSDLVISPVFDDSVEMLHCFPRRVGTGRTLLERVPLIYVPQLAQSQALIAQLPKLKIGVTRMLPCSSLELVKSLVIDEVGVGILPRRVAAHNNRKRLHSLSPALPRYRDRIALVRRYDIAPTAANRLVIDQLTAHCKAMS